MTVYATTEAFVEKLLAVYRVCRQREYMQSGERQRMIAENEPTLEDKKCKYFLKCDPTGNEKNCMYLPECEPAEDEKKRQYFQKCGENAVEYAYSRGWADASDVMNRELPIERRNAAALVHEFLKKEMKEPDDDDWNPAKRLRDLYDCHVCVNHVAQVFVKGIMGAIDTDGMNSTENSSVFGMHELVSDDEALQIALRAVNPEARLKNAEEKAADKEAKEEATAEEKAADKEAKEEAAAEEKVASEEAKEEAAAEEKAASEEAKEEAAAEEKTAAENTSDKLSAEKSENVYFNERRLSMDEATALYEKAENAVLIDVRSQLEFEAGHLKNAINIPMAKIIDGGDGLKKIFPDGKILKQVPLFLYCDAGYQSEVAARCLSAGGFDRVFWFGTEGRYQN